MGIRWLWRLWGGASIGVTMVLGAIGWLQPLGSPLCWGLWGGWSHWGHHDPRCCGVGALIGVTVGAMGWVTPLGSPWWWGLRGV